MTTESGLKLRTKLESAKTLTFTNAATNATHAAGAMTVIGSTIGAVVENVGTASQAVSDTYPNGPDGVLVYEAEKIVLPKATGTSDSFAVGASIYYDAANKNITATSTGNTKCGRALEAAGASATEVLADLMVLS
jgi:hypothetical protein